ncbi:hypothetical protein JCM11641_007639 [Rhodosporidiobolus odoratus]
MAYKLPRQAGSRAGRPTRASLRVATSPSSVAVGTAYELACQSFLAKPPFNLAKIIRVGGAGDQGVDLRGRWPGAPLLSTTEKATGSPLAERVVEWETVIQCKAYNDRLGPAVVRELEGTMLATQPAFSPPTVARLSSSTRSTTHNSSAIIGFLISLSGFTTDAIFRANASRLPIALLHLQPKDPERLTEAAQKRGRSSLAAEEMILASVGYSLALLRLFKADRAQRDGMEKEAEGEDNGGSAVG